MSQDVIRQIGSALVFPAALVGAVSVIVFSRVPWWRTSMGRHLMTYMTLIAAVLILSAIRQVTGDDSWWFTLLRVVAFAGVLAAMTQRLYLLVKAQRDDARVLRSVRRGWVR